MTSLDMPGHNARMEARGNDGVVRWDGQWLTIAREGLAAGMVHGRGETRFHVGQITGIQVKKPGMSTGRFTVIVPGGEQRGSSAKAHRDDPLTVRFYGKHLQEFEAIRVDVERARATGTAAPTPPTGGLGDELAKLASLHQSGALTDAEFAAAKARLLGGGA